MDNILEELSKDGKTLTLKIDLTKPLGKSKTGKTTLLASSRGNYEIATPSGAVMVGVNVYTK